MRALTRHIERFGPAVAKALFVGLLLGTAIAVLPQPAAAVTARTQWTVRLDGQDVSATSSSDPVRFNPGRTLRVDVSLTNHGSTRVVVRDVKIEGRLLGLSFFTYATEVNLVVGPNATETRRYTVNLVDLQGQATGLIPARVVLYDDKGGVIASRWLVVDVRGSLRSVYGTFGIAVALITLLLLGSALWRLRTDRLPENRWRRAMAFAVPGLGVGFILTFTMSALRWIVPAPPTWTLLLMGGAVVGFSAGYLTPTPGGTAPGTPTIDDEPTSGEDAVTLHGLEAIDVPDEPVAAHLPGPDRTGDWP